MRQQILMALAVAALTLAGPAAAYIGPGAGLSLVGALWGLLLAVFAAVGFILLWPLRRMARRRRQARARRDGATQSSVQGEADETTPGERPRSR